VLLRSTSTDEKWGKKKTTGQRMEVEVCDRVSKRTKQTVWKSEISMTFQRHWTIGAWPLFHPGVWSLDKGHLEFKHDLDSSYLRQPL
jgi:hypothetical protein